MQSAEHPGVALVMRIRNFSKSGDAIPVPPLAEMQKAAYERFLQPDCGPDRREVTGLEALFRDFFPVVSRDGSLRVEYVGYFLGAPAHLLQECRDLGLTYARPLHARLRVVASESIEEDVYIGEVPCMIGAGEFIINGAERVVVAQIQRSPGVDFAEDVGADGRTTHSCRFIPERGPWVEFIVGRRDVLQVRLGQSGLMPATWLLRAMLPGSDSNGQIASLFYGVEEIPLGKEGASRIAGRWLADDVVNKDTGELVAAACTRVDPDLAAVLAASGMERLSVLKDVSDPLILRTIENDQCRSRDEALVRIYHRFRPGEPASPQRAAVFFDERFANPRNYSLGRVGRFRINRKLGQSVPADMLTLCGEDIVNAIRYLMRLRRREGAPDDIDHLGNRVLRLIDRLLEPVLRDAFARWTRAIQGQLDLATGGIPTPRSVAATRAIATALEDFFARSELSQVVDQTNPLAEINHLRRISALGPGGLNRKRAGFEVRDVHPSHYGRICPIETPEGPNIGLIASLSIFARVDEYGFLTTPYRSRLGDGEVRYLRADEESAYTLAPLHVGATDDGEVVVRKGGEVATARLSEVDLVDVSPRQMLGVSASLIPFLEHNDANRALMGSNMQRQAVPLLRTEPPIVATGMEVHVATSSSMVVTALKAGRVTYADASRVVIGDLEYTARKFDRLNDDTCLNQRPAVREGDEVAQGQVIFDGAATSGGELSLGRNVLCAFMIWDGYNFEDAIIVSRSVVEEDKYTSVHVQEYSVDLRETQLGPEEFTRDIPNVSQRALANLDDEGIVRVGTKVSPGDILVGKVAPKTKTDLTPEERLLREIFGAAGVEVSNESLVMPPGPSGVVIDVRHYRRRSRMTEEERADARRRSKTVRAQCSERLAEAIRAMVADLRRLPDETGALFDGLPADSAPARDWIAFEQTFRFDPTAFPPEMRDEAQRRYNIHKQTIDALRAELEQRLRRARTGDELPAGVLERVKVLVAVKRPLAAGDKMAGRHGNKGVIARIVPKEDMPFLPDGTPVEVILNPLGVPSRMNVGQILETHLAWAGKALGFRAITPAFDGATEDEIRQCLREAGLPEDGKVTLYDGRTGEPFDQKVTVGYIYLMKLNHLVDDKIHARATGPYSLITQQPLGGKARMGGQRVGEMEVWALEAYGAAYLLQEMLTVKSDAVESRSAMYESIVKGQNLLVAGTPVSFDVLVNELRGLGLNLELVRGRTEREETPAARAPVEMPAMTSERS